MESAEKEAEKKIRYRKKRVFVGKNRFSDVPIFEERKVPIITPENSGDFQPSIDELPPVPKDSLQGKEIQYTKIKPKKNQDPLY